MDDANRIKWMTCPYRKDLVQWINIEKKLADFYHIPLENILAFGDENNDLEMLAFAGHGVAMANGTPQAKDKANHITKFSNDEDGLARYLMQYFQLEI